jgi:pyruvate-formate lyase-activating enzyme
MAFDTKSPTPKVLFSPVGAVSDDDLETIARQAKSPAAEAAIKLNVYQTDTSGETEVAQPEEVAEPVKRESKAPAGEKAADTAEVIKKWSKK